jgi:hypothetical protein
MSASWVGVKPVLLAAEIVADAAPLRTHAVGAVMQINRLKPLGDTWLRP